MTVSYFGQALGNNSWNFSTFSTHPTLQLNLMSQCYNSEENSCNFLDLKISVKEGKIRTDLYRKETDKPRALLPTSAHPNHIPSNIVYSMAFRLLRICDNEQLFEERLLELKNNFLIPRNYTNKLINNQFNRVRELPGNTYAEKRNLALEKKQRVNGTDRVIGVFDYNPVLPKIGSVITKHYRTMISDNPELKEPFPKPPMAALRQGPNLRRILCRSSLYKVSKNPVRATHRSSAGWKRCSASGKRQCPICPYTPNTATSITSHITGYTHHITSPINCQTENIVYAWKCTKCNENFTVNTNNRHTQSNNQQVNKIGSNYIGLSKRKFSKRLSEHRDYPKAGKVDEPSGQHFTLPGHSVSNLQGLAIEHVKNKDPFVLKAREAFIIKKFY